MNNKDKISICIATYKRQSLLEKLLLSILNQRNLKNYSIEFLVVDNDKGKSAEAVSLKIESIIKKKPSFSIKYDVQPEKNIALTRNKAVELATGEYIFFIDDDEYADDYWIYNLLLTLKNFDADVVFGPVYPYFNQDVPNWIKKCSVYYKVTNITGKKAYSFYTSNCLIKKEVIDKFNPPFDPNYGITGGEDHEFFIRVANSGYKMVSCKEALVYEFIPNDRANIKWLIKRVFRTGNNYTRTLIINDGKQSIILSIGQLLKGSIQSIVALLLSIIFIWNLNKCLDWFLKSVSNLGKIFAVFRLYPKEYKS